MAAALVLSLLLIGAGVLGQATLAEFAIALFVGMATGAYSSIFVAAPVLAIWKEREEHWQRVRIRDTEGVVHIQRRAIPPVVARMQDKPPAQLDRWR